LITVYLIELKLDAVNNNMIVKQSVKETDLIHPIKAVDSVQYGTVKIAKITLIISISD